MSTQETKRCVYCESDKEPYFSRSEPMGFYCVECGHNFDEIDPEDYKEIKAQLTAERALADRLARFVEEGIEDMDTFLESRKALAAWKEARSE